MKTLIALLIGCLAFANINQIDTTGLPEDVKETVEKIQQEKKINENLSYELTKESNKTAILKEAIQKLLGKKIHPKIQENKNVELIKVNPINALNKDNEIIYWEEIPRKWIGRIFNKSDYRIRIYKFDENKNKIYLN
ncbi:MULTISPECIES: hypothetical protein [Elizabethkingia]|uniref:hypothetical protein n=1 Tax=Elizabethkingia TaxID=308865 RepID=UPI0010C1BE1E|nr:MULTISPECIES: hypothetical protein [Elizabethkingia]QCO45759.1 hypothetical protein FCS00_05015 [Elizabethkingia sp. 2-6]WQM37688.1 hypothetical protein U2S95_15115 [Elizabethkingia miricola]